MAKSFITIINNLKDELEEAIMKVSLAMEKGLDKVKTLVEFMYPKLALDDLELFKVVVDAKLVKEVTSPDAGAKRD